MPKRPTLSPSKITTYLACPVKYYWTYVNPKGKWYVRSKSVFSFGLSLHEVLQRFHDTGDRGVTTTEEAVAALEESWIEAGYGSQDEMMQSLAEGKAIVEAHVERALREPTTANTIAVEKLVRRELGFFDLIGRIDRIDEHPDGRIEIIDYKSGRESVSVEDIRNDLAMGCYQLILQGEYPDREISATIIALRSGQRASYSMVAAELSEFRFLIEQIGQEVLGREWEEFTPVAKERICGHCDFLNLCRQVEGFELDLEAGNDQDA
jgi:RecB family exonuclease